MAQNPGPISLTNNLFWTERRKNQLLLVLVCSAFLGVGFSLLNTNPNSSLHRGDFPAFYAAGKIILEGRGAELYDFRLQEQYEHEAWPEMSGYLAFAYPPYVAAFFAQLSRLSPQTAKLLYTAILALFLLASVFLAVKEVPIACGQKWAAVLVIFLFPPIFHGILSGQNVTVSILCHVLIIRLVSGKGGLTVAAGVALGLWFFKPHYALIVGSGMLLLRLAPLSWLLGLLPVLGIFYGLSNHIAGPDGFEKWLEALRYFSSADAISNAHQMISPVGMADALAQSGLIAAPVVGVLHTLAYVLVLLAILSVVLLRVSSAPGVESGNHELKLDMLWLLAPAAVIISPHSLYYDLGLFVLPVSRLIRPKGESHINRIILAYLIAFMCVALKDYLPFQPLAVIAYLTLFWLLKKTAEKHRLINSSWLNFGSGSVNSTQK